MVVATACQIGDQLGVSEGVRLHGLQLPVFRNGGRFAVRVPVEKLLSPELIFYDLLGTCKALGDLRGRRGQHLLVTEAVHVAHLKAIDKQPVETGKIVSTSLEGRRMGFLKVESHRTRKVHWVLLPRSWSRRFKSRYCRRL